MTVLMIRKHYAHHIAIKWSYTLITHKCAVRVEALQSCHLKSLYQRRELF